MDSRPPASAMADSPMRTWSAAIISAFMPDPHILLTVVAGTDAAMPAASAACRAGAWPRPAGSTQPKTTSSSASPGTPASASAARAAAAPSCGAVALASAPWNAPIGVRRAATITVSFIANSSRSEAPPADAADGVSTRPRVAGRV